MITNKDIEQYKHLVYNIINKYRDRTFKHKTYIDWDEMEQVGMIALYKALKNYNPNKGSSFMNYAIISIARAIKRHEKFEHQIESHTDIEEFYGIINPIEEDIDTSIDNTVIINRIKELINTSSILQKSKDILLLRLSGLTLQEIADKYNCSIQNVSSIIYKNLKRIKKKL